jgi:hypothetical protein
MNLAFDLSFTFSELDDLKNRLGAVVQAKPQAAECLEGTRMSILSDIEDKINPSEDKNTEAKTTEDRNIIWIRGAPGSGKSSVSLSTKSRLHKHGRLVTYFRFDRNEATVTTPSALWCCVAYDLADRYPSVLKHNLSLLRENKVNLTSTMDLFTSLVEEPLLNLTSTDSIPPDHPLVIVIDALDECGGFEGRSSPDRKALLQTLRRWPKLSKYFKLLVTSREEGDISGVLTSISEPVDIPSGHSLAENPQAKASIEASNDIRMFLEGRFQDIRERFPSLPGDWPGTTTVTEMVCRAAGIFMWAITATNFIDCRGISPKGRLRKIMDNAFDSTSMKPLYSLYTSILEISFGDISGGDPEAEVLRSVLSTMVLAKRPLHDIEYTKLPTTEPVSEDMLDSIRDGLRSVVAPGALRFVHKSFEDFLLSEECPRKYAIRMEESQHLLTTLCLTTMTANLRFNICRLGTSSLKNADVPDIEIKVKECIPDLLSYSCYFWTEHLVLTPFNNELMGTVKDMIFDKLLYWFEVMSLLREINRVSHSLLLVLKWSNVCILLIVNATLLILCSPHQMKNLRSSSVMLVNSLEHLSIQLL